MSDKKDFYIGWKDEIPKENKSLLKKFLVPIFISIPILFLIMVWFQKPFNNHFFEFGQTSEITGTYFHTPYPMLIADEQMVQENLSKDILLVGYGKFGAEGTMDAIQKKHGNLNGKKITLQGTLTYGDGKTILELTQEEKSFVKIDNENISPSPLKSSTPISVQGEILDPKCYFGVMKPGEGKVHKSCAIRCISGGIPPVLRHETGNQAAPYKYYLLVDETGKTINQEVLPFVAEQVAIDGNARSFASWDILYINVEHLKMVN